MPTFTDLPPQIAALPVDHRGYPVPWFVGIRPDTGVYDFRYIRPGAIFDALKHELCWVCGESRKGDPLAYVAGPMCAVNRTSAEPPSHRHCAIFSARTCPFLAKPHMKRRTVNAPKDAVAPAGNMIARNPGAALVWVSSGPVEIKHLDPKGGVLFELGDPLEVLWFAQGRDATREEVMESINSGLPILQEMAATDGPDAERELQRYVKRALRLAPA
jgi:hypothetical protein